MPSHSSSSSASRSSTRSNSSSASRTARTVSATNSPNTTESNQTQLNTTQSTNTTQPKTTQSTNTSQSTNTYQSTNTSQSTNQTQSNTQQPIQSNGLTLNHLFMYHILFGNRNNNTPTVNRENHPQIEQQIKDKKCESQLKKYQDCVTQKQSQGIKITENVCKKEIEGFRKCFEKHNNSK